MFKKLYFLLAIILIFASCNKEQNLDTTVIGEVINHNSIGVANVTIYIMRGKSNPDNWWPANYQKYDSVLTNAVGEYYYLIKHDTYSYQICSTVPSGYSKVDEFCKKVTKVLEMANPAPNIINFKLSP